MFAPISPTLKNLLTRLENQWAGSQAFVNEVPAENGNAAVSPSLTLEGRGFTTSNSSSRPHAFRMYMQPFQASTSYGEWRLQYSDNNGAFTNSLRWNSKGAVNASKPLFTADAYGLISTDNSSAVETQPSLNVASSGTTNHIAMSYAGTVRSSWSVSNQGNTEFRAGGTAAQYNFRYGSSITSQSLIAQLYSGGYYSNLNNYNGGKVTAGNADTSANSTLSTFGSFAAKGILVTSATYTLGDAETFVYADPSQSNFCLGTPAVTCASLSSEGSCNAKNLIGCNWFSGTSCSDSGSGTDQSTCESQGAGCTWETLNCDGASNTDQSICEGQGSDFGGGCTYDTSTCPSQTDGTSCSSIPGCTWNFSPCDIYNLTDQSSCESNAGCTWFDDGSNCSTYGDESTCNSAGCIWDSGGETCGGACSGEYDTSCTGDLCTGTYASGACNGSFGAFCNGTANCGLITSSGTCNSESGCNWESGIVITLPTTASANRNGTGRVYSIMHVGNTGTVSIAGQSGQPVFQFTTLNLLKKGDKVLLHNQNITFQCSMFTSSSPCTSQAGCAWLPACDSLGDEESCNNISGCAWDSDNGVCTGPTSARCSGTYSNGSHWYAHSLERGLNYIARTANYTLLDIDDVVDVTSGSITLSLPKANLLNGKRYILKNSGAGSVTVDPDGSETINGSATATIAAGASLEIISNNSNWISV